MNKQEIEQAIENLDQAIKHLMEGLPFADGPAYSQDKARINGLRIERWKLLKLLEAGQ